MLRITAFALVVLCLCSPVRADEAEDKAVAFVEKLRGKVVRDEKAPGKPVISLYVGGTKLTDAGLKELAALKSLTSLELNGTEVTDEGLKELAPFKNLTSLGLSKNTQMTDRALTVLRELNLLHTLVWAKNADGKRSPAKPEDVTKLDLNGTKVTDVGLKELAHFKNLTWLELGYTKVTDAGLKELAQLKNLTYIELSGTKLVTDAGVKELLKALPKCKISK